MDPAKKVVITSVIGQFLTSTLVFNLKKQTYNNKKKTILPTRGRPALL